MHLVMELFHLDFTRKLTKYVRFLGLYTCFSQDYIHEVWFSAGHTFDLNTMHKWLNPFYIWRKGSLRSQHSQSSDPNTKSLCPFLVASE